MSGNARIPQIMRRWHERVHGEVGLRSGSVKHTNSVRHLCASRHLLLDILCDTSEGLLSPLRSSHDEVSCLAGRSHDLTNSATAFTVREISQGKRSCDLVVSLFRREAYYTQGIFLFMPPYATLQKIPKKKLQDHGHSYNLGLF